MSKSPTTTGDKTISLKCRECLADLAFIIPSSSVQVGQFPIKLEQVHGEPAHKLVIFINKKLEVESFEIQAVAEKSAVSIGILEEVLGDIGLSQKETQLYFHCTRLGPVSVGEMSLLIELPVETVSEIAKKFVSKGLFKEIAGATLYYQALPPYAALLTQLQKFAGFIGNIKDETPRELQRSFSTFEQSTKGVQNLKEFVTYLIVIKDDVSNSLNTQKQALDGTLDRLKNQQEIIPFITSLRDQSSSLLDHQVKSLDQQLTKNEAMLDQQISMIENQLGVIQDKITRNLEKLRLGVILQTVQDVIQKIMKGEIEAIRQSFQNEIKVPFRQMITSLKDSFQKEFGAPFRSLLTQLSTKIQGVSMDAGKIDDDLRTLFTSILSQFGTTLTDASTRIQGISDSVLTAFSELRNTFAQNVIVTLDDVLGKVLTRLNMSTKTIEEFWQDAKRVIRVSAKDIWFVRTPEGMKAQIIDASSRAKMKLLIIAPTLTDIDVQSILQAPKFINVRVAARIQTDDAKHRQILDSFASHPNITVRQWDLQNLWAINRDSEEVIVGIVSKLSSGVLDVAGIGSTLQEHIKIFAGILEDAWIGSRKDFGYTASAGTATAEVIASPISNVISKRLDTVVALKGPGQAALKPTPAQVSAKPATVPVKPGVKPIKPRPASVSTPPDEETEQTPEPALETGVSMEDIMVQVDAFMKKIDSYESATDFARDLEALRDFIYEKKGFHTILNEMKNVVGSLRHGAKWDSPAKESMRQRMINWKEKLLT